MTGVPGDQVRKVAEVMAKNRPSTLIWCMGITQHTVGTANVRALQHPATGAGEYRRRGRRGQHLPGALQRAGRHRLGLGCDLAAGLLRADRGRLEALEPGLGRRLRVDEGRASSPRSSWRRRASRRPAGSTPCWRSRTRSTSRHPSRRWWCSATAATPSPACRRCGRGWRRWTCWSSPTRIRPPSRRSADGRTGPICCRSAPSSRRTGRAPRPTARSSGPTGWSSRSSSRRTTTT